MTQPGVEPGVSEPPRPIGVPQGSSPPTGFSDVLTTLLLCQLLQVISSLIFPSRSYYIFLLLGGQRVPQVGVSLGPLLVTRDLVPAIRPLLCITLLPLWGVSVFCISFNLGASFGLNFPFGFLWFNTLGIAFLFFYIYLMTTMFLFPFPPGPSSSLLLGCLFSLSVLNYFASSPKFVLGIAQLLGGSSPGFYSYFSLDSIFRLMRELWVSLVPFFLGLRLF